VSSNVAGINRRRITRIALGVILAGAFLYLTVVNVDAAKTLRSIMAARLPFVALGLGAVAAGFSLRIVRWWLLLKPLSPSLRPVDCAGPLLVGFALNNILPFRAGDVVRVFGFQRQLGAGPPQVLGTLLAERALDLIAILIIFMVCLSQAHIDAIPTSFVRIGVGLALLSVVAAGIILMWPEATQRLVLRLTRSNLLMRHSLTRRIGRIAEHVADALLSFVPRSRAMGLVALSLLIWLIEAAVFGAIATSLGLMTEPLGPLFAMATGTLATMIPSTPGYVGTFDFFTRIGLETFGASAELSTAAAFTVHAVLWWPVTLVGLALVVYVRPALGSVGSVDAVDGSVA